MTDKQWIHSVEFNNAAELAKGLMELIAMSHVLYDGSAVVYVTAHDGFSGAGTAVLVETTLTDGSKVYDIQIKDWS